MSLASKRIEHIDFMETQRNMSAELMRKVIKEMEDALNELKNKKKKNQCHQKLDNS